MEQTMSTRIEYDYLIKVLIIGDSGSGKTALLLKMCDNTFTPSYITTIGVDFRVRTVSHAGKTIKLQIWDTAGQERFRTITTAYYRGAHMIYLVYDVTDAKTFGNVNNWMRNIQQHATENVMTVIVGCKADLSDRQVIEPNQAKALADELRMGMYQTSAKTGQGIEELMMGTVTTYYDERIIPASQDDQARYNPSVLNISKPAPPTHKKRCAV